MVDNFSEKASFIWSVADLLRGPYRPNQYKDVMLPLTVLRRLDCVLEPTKDEVLEVEKQLAGKGKGILEAKLTRVAGAPFYNTSRYTFEKLKGDPDNIAANLTAYIKGFSAHALGVLVERLRQAPAFQKLADSKKRKDTKAAQAEIEAGRKLQQSILAALDVLAPKGVLKNRDEFAVLMKTCFKAAGLKIQATLTKAILGALSEQDKTADVCLDAKGNPESDPELRDYENVPLKEDVTAYMQREVLPHVPDAWVDESKTKVGYEINFNRYFHKYQPLRPPDEIESDLKKIEAEIPECWRR